jgi:hypothetical protein
MGEAWKVSTEAALWWPAHEDLLKGERLECKKKKIRAAQVGVQNHPPLGA